jgi:hypothetical protein
MAKMVKAVRMILGLEPFGPTIKKPSNGSPDIEIGDDEPKRKPSLEEIDALEVNPFSVYSIRNWKNRFCLDYYCVLSQQF